MKTPIQKSKKKTTKKIKSSPKIILKTILVPIDFSPQSDKALNYAISLAKQFNSKIEILHIYEPMNYSGDVVFNQATYPIVDIEYKKFDDEKFNKLISTIKNKYEKTTFTTISGFATTEIINFAENKKIDLIILGTHLKKGLERLLFGNSTEKIIRDAHCPVLIVHSQDRDFIK